MKPPPDMSPKLEPCAVRPVTGPYWTPAAEGALWLNLLVESETANATLDAIQKSVRLQIEPDPGAPGDGEQRHPTGAVASPVWPGIWAVRFCVEGRRWRAARIHGERWRTPACGVPRPFRAESAKLGAPPRSRFLILSDMQSKPLVTATVPATGGVIAPEVHSSIS
jgi:hypothetical protein